MQPLGRPNIDRGGEGSVGVGTADTAYDSSSAACCCIGERQSLHVSWRANLPAAFQWLQPGHLRCCARMRTTKTAITTARERGPISDASALIVQLSIFCLTIVEL